MRDGVLHQCATPQEIVRNPATPFVGSFVLQNNVIPVWTSSEGELSCPLGSLKNRTSSGAYQQNLPSEACVLVEPEAIGVVSDPKAEASVLGREFLGDLWEYRIDFAGMILRARCSIEQDFMPNERCRVALKKGASVTLLPQRINLSHSFA
jgi:iron(III) transport system ATP-binding protein